MSDKTLVEIVVTVTEVQVNEAGVEQKGFRHKITVAAQTLAFPNWDSTAQRARALGRKAVRMVLDRDNMMVHTAEEEARLEAQAEPA